LAAQEARETPALADNADTASASLEDPDYIESATPAPTPGARTLSGYSSAPTNLEQTIPSLATETEDLGWLIDTEDLRHGRVPHPKPRYVSVDHNPVDPPGAPPLLEEPTPTPRVPSDASSLLSITASPGRVRPLLLERWPLPPGVVPPVAEPLVSLPPELDERGPREGVRHRPLWLLPRSRLGIPFPTRLKVPITTIAPYPGQPLPLSLRATGGACESRLLVDQAQSQSIGTMLVRSRHPGMRMPVPGTCRGGLKASGESASGVRL